MPLKHLGADQQSKLNAIVGHNAVVVCIYISQQEKLFVFCLGGRMG